MFRGWCILLILLMACTTAFAAGSPSAKPEVLDVVVDARDGGYVATLSLLVAVPPPIALEVLTDFDHMADFVPNLNASRLLARNGNVFRVAQQGRAEFGPFSFRFESERQVELFPEGRLVAQRLSGSPKAMRSELRVLPNGAGTRIDYRIEMLPDHWFPSSIGTHFIRHELAEQFLALGREMEGRFRKLGGR